jgi:hypothetical protein
MGCCYTKPAPASRCAVQLGLKHVPSDEESRGTHVKRLVISIGSIQMGSCPETCDGTLSSVAMLPRHPLCLSILREGS